MVRNQYFSWIANAFIIAFGASVFWHLDSFRPYNSHYPPALEYRPASSDSVFASPGSHYSASGFKAIWLGQHLRPLWTTPVKVALFDEYATRHDLRATGRGGGMQTTRFTLTDRSGRTYNLRSIDKNPLGTVPKFFWNTIVLGFLRDQISATDPYAMPVVAKLEVAAGITSSVPVILFLRPGEARLNSLAGNSQGFFSLELKEEDPAGLMQAGESFIKMYDTDKMKALLAQSAGNEKVDTARFLHCRLFDLLIGDWDRHGGQWDWLAFNDENHTVFRPVPKDRDQALAYYKDGIVPWVLSRKFLLRKISSFEGKFEDVEGSLQNGRELDEWLLKDLSENGFVAAAVALQKTIPDEVLEEAVAQYPAVFKDTRRAAVLEILKQRRAKLPEVARQFYRALHREK